MILLAIDWAGAGIKAVYFIMSFSILVVLHELGHFFPAKWFKCRVEKFYLFFNPWFSLYKKKIGNTEWGLGWVPFGGYVKIAGMIDESVDKEQMKLPPKPDEFRSKKAWQRLIIMLGGVIVNVILAIVIFIGISWVWGDEFIPPQNAKWGLYADSLGRQAGLQDGDIITRLDTTAVKDITKVAPLIVSREVKTMTVLRDGKEIQLAIPEGMIRSLNDNKASGFVELQFPTIIDSIPENSPNKNIQVGDQIVGIDSIKTPYFINLVNALDTYKNKSAILKVIRNGNAVDVPVKVDDKGTIGFSRQSFDKMGITTETQKYTFLQAIPAGLKRCGNTLSMYVTGLKQLFTGKANPNKSLGSVVSIGGIFPNQWGMWKDFWTLTAVFSIILAFMNVLPIPALDGGHALFTIYEMITGRKPGDKFMEYAQMVGMILLLGLMAYALGLDFFRLFTGK